MTRLLDRRWCVQDLVGKPEGKRQLGTPRHRWEDNIKADLQEIDRRVWSGLIWIRAQICTWAVVHTMILQVQYNTENFMTSWETDSCSMKLVNPSQSTFILFNSLFSTRGREMFYLTMLSVAMILQHRWWMNGIWVWSIGTMILTGKLMYC